MTRNACWNGGELCRVDAKKQRAVAEGTETSRRRPSSDLRQRLHRATSSAVPTLYLDLYRNSDIGPDTVRYRRVRFVSLTSVL